MRRALLRSARRLVARDSLQLTPESHSAHEYNQWREALARDCLDDPDLVPAARADAALSALMRDVTVADDVHRIQTQALCGEAFVMKARFSGDVEDVVAAASYYSSAWTAAGSIRESTNARRAAELWLRSSLAERRHASGLNYPPDVLARSADRVAEWRRNAEILYQSLHEQSERTLRRVAAVLDPASGADLDIDKAWVLRLQALGTHDHLPGEAIEALGLLLEHELRDRLRDFMSHSSAAARAAGREQSAEEEFARLRAALKESEEFPLGETQIASLVRRVLHDQHRGRIGLALSGGGFRASFYHLGVLARLADVDLLRSVDVISGVSG
ncbi:MAG: hypothetical protein ACRDF6_06205, partial [bacterium]